MSKKYYRVNHLVQEIEVYGVPEKLSFADGMIGCAPIFTNKRKAQKWANKFPKNIRPSIHTVYEVVR